MATEQGANSPRWVRSGEAASILGVSTDTLKEWTDLQIVPSFRAHPRAHRLYDRDTLITIRHEMDEQATRRPVPASGAA